MKANLVYNNKSIIVDIDDTLANLSILCDVMIPDDTNFEPWHKAYQHVRKCYVGIARLLISPDINHCEFLTFSPYNVKGDDIVDNVHFFNEEQK